MLLPNEDSIIFKMTDENCRGIIWLHEGPFQKSSPLFEQLNYLSNGLIFKSMSNQSISNLFHSQNFGKSFYIFSCDMSAPDLKKRIDNFVKIIKDFDTESHNLFFLEPESSHHGKTTRSHYSKIKFNIHHY